MPVAMCSPLPLMQALNLSKMQSFSYSSHSCRHQSAQVGSCAPHAKLLCSEEAAAHSVSSASQVADT